MRIRPFLLAALVTFPALAQESPPLEELRPPALVERNLSGPRLGMTWIPGGSDLSRALKAQGLSPLVSQFGWHFENRVRPLSGGPSFVVETIPLVAGVEYGKFYPSVTLAMGLRLANGVEFGMGPNLLIARRGGLNEFSTSLVVAAGRSFEFSGLSIPVNLALATSPEGQRLSLIFGYALTRSGEIREAE